MRILDKEKEAKLEELIREAGKILLEYWPGGDDLRKNELEVFTKEDGSIVTTADFEANNLIINGLRKLFPDMEIMSEELPDTHDGARGDKLWILDPLDGTKRFAEGTKDFCILLGLAEQGRMVYGVMYQPVVDRYLFASKGQGTLLNGDYIRVSDSESIKPASVFVEHLKLPPSGLLVKDGIDSTDAFLELCRGNLDAVVIRLTAHKSWDLAPFSILVEESGGRFSDEKGTAPLFESKTPGMKYVVASNGRVHEELLSFVSKGCSGAL